jgi:hypothetical protein
MTADLRGHAAPTVDRFRRLGEAWQLDLQVRHLPGHNWPAKWRARLRPGSRNSPDMRRTAYGNTMDEAMLNLINSMPFPNLY